MLLWNVVSLRIAAADRGTSPVQRWQIIDVASSGVLLTGPDVTRSVAFDSGVEHVRGPIPVGRAARCLRACNGFVLSDQVTLDVRPGAGLDWVGASPERSVTAIPTEANGRSEVLMADSKELVIRFVRPAVGPAHVEFVAPGQALVREVRALGATSLISADRRTVVIHLYDGPSPLGALAQRETIVARLNDGRWTVAASSGDRRTVCTSSDGELEVTVDGAGQTMLGPTGAAGRVALPTISRVSPGLRVPCVIDGAMVRLVQRVVRAGESSVLQLDSGYLPAQRWRLVTVNLEGRVLSSVDVEARSVLLGPSVRHALLIRDELTVYEADGPPIRTVIGVDDAVLVAPNRALVVDSRGNLRDEDI